MAEGKHIAYERNAIEEVLRFLGTCPYDAVVKHVYTLARCGIEVEVKLPEAPKETKHGPDQ